MMVGASAGLRFSVRDIKKVDACVLESASEIASVMLPKKLPPVSLGTWVTVIGSVMNCRNADACALESADVMFSEIVRA